MKQAAIWNWTCSATFCAFHRTETFPRYASTRSEGWRYRSNSLTISAIGLQFRRMIYSTIKQTLIQNGGAPPLLAHFTDLKTFHDRHGPVCRMMTHIRKSEEVTSWPEICNVQWSGSLFEMAMLYQCSHFLILAGRGCCRSLNILFTRGRARLMSLSLTALLILSDVTIRVFTFIRFISIIASNRSDYPFLL